MKPITIDSKISEIWDTPVGHDILAKALMQMGMSEKIIQKPIIRSLRVKSLLKLAKSTPLFKNSKDPNAAEKLEKTLIDMFSAEKDQVIPKDGDPTPAWWKEAVFYQIYPRSFCDTDGDGTGDIRGIISKLDYLKDLGINALWLSPIYDSPQDDNGYDIRDYRKIDKMFGTMEDFDELLEEVHKRGMHLIMDLVVNHTSDEHEWFQKALADPASKYRNYYFFRDAQNDGSGSLDAAKNATGVQLQDESASNSKDSEPQPPNNWQSFFGGNAWNWYPEQKAFALHLFSKKQMDLNWDNPELRKEVIDMIKFWLEKGVDGFRMDVINYISKVPGLPDGDETIGELSNFAGIEHYVYGPHLHEYLKQIRKEAFEPYKAFSVGETPVFGMEMARLTTAEERHELDMIFSFDHLETPGHVRYDDYKYDLNFYRDYITDWMENYGSQCWMSLFYNNHDNPRMASKVDHSVSKDPQLRRRIQGLLAVMQFTLRGTPFVYQGDEMGLVNYDFKDMSELTDVEVRGLYKRFLETLTPSEAWEKALCGTRDHARVLLPWNKLPEDRQHLVQQPDELIESIYRKLIALRAANPALIYGDFRLLNGKKDHFCYERTLSAAQKRSGRFVIDCNLSSQPQKAGFDGSSEGLTLVFSSENDLNEGSLNQKNLAPYEARIWREN